MPRGLLDPFPGFPSGEKNERRKNPPGRRRRRRRRRGARQRRGRRRRPRRRRGGQRKKRRAKVKMMMMTSRERKLPIRPPMAYWLNRWRVSVCRRAISIKRGNTSKSKRHWPGFARCVLFTFPLLVLLFKTRLALSLKDIFYHHADPGK